MIFCVFSYNRGVFLANCVNSIEELVPQAEVHIFDDGSDDPDTLRILASLEGRHQLTRMPRQVGGKHGGLYASMQEALENCPDAPLVCFLQDDMQIVRPLSAAEINEFQACFERDPRAGFLQPCFLKGATRRRDEAHLYFDEASRTYRRRDSGQSAGIHYSDVFIASPARLLACGWRFAPSEPGNERQARRLFGPQGQLFTPFAMWLPDVPAYRGKRRTLALRLAERRHPSGFHPFQRLDADALAALERRPPRVLPFAEDFLSLSPASAAAPPPKPWRYHPLQGSRWLKKLNSYETFLRSLPSAARKLLIWRTFH